MTPDLVHILDLGEFLYLLFVDESGTHGDSHAFVLGGIAIHESDTQRLQQALDALVVEKLERVPPNLDEYELHASEMRNAKKPRPDEAKAPAVTSIWANVSRSLRLELLDAAYELIANFETKDPQLPAALFGVVVDRNFRADWSQIEKERFAYEVLLNKFDMLLKTLRVKKGLPNRGLVIHDRRVVAERDIQSWTSEWRAAAGNIGQLMNLADVPLFADSRATRLLQVADLVSYALYRRYNPTIPKEPNFATIWPRFHKEKTHVHGCVHYSPSFGQGSCACEPCTGRLEADTAQFIQASTRPKRTRMRTRRGRVPESSAPVDQSD
ncbi:DUF3800 domain-containing protein [Nocardioides sp. HB32]